MDRKAIGFLHPGSMGVSLAATAIRSDYTACWVSAERSPETRKRAEEHGLLEVQSLAELCARCAVIVSVCPPEFSMAVAESVAAHSYRGIFTDANAVSPERVRQIGGIVARGGADFVDGGIIGPPAWKPATTWLYLSGHSASVVASCFAAGPLEVEDLGEEIGRASALKMCFAANTKGTIALQCIVTAAAERLGVRSELERQWSKQDSEYTREILDSIRKVTAKAWRFSGEMEEIAATLESAGLPAGFHLAARDVYDRIAGFRGAENLPSLEEVIDALLSSGE